MKSFTPHPEAPLTDLGYVLSPMQSAQSAAVQHQALGPWSLCHHPPFVSLGTIWRPQLGSGRRAAQSICNESKISVEKKILMCFCSVRNEVILPPLLVGRSEVIPQRRGKSLLALHFGSSSPEILHSYGFCQVWNLGVKIIAKTREEKGSVFKDCSSPSGDWMHEGIPQSYFSPLCIRLGGWYLPEVSSSQLHMKQLSKNPKTVRRKVWTRAHISFSTQQISLWSYNLATF